MEYKAYSFDLDDNLLKMPTKIYLEGPNGEKKGYSTLDFEKIRTKLEELGLKMTNESLVEFENENRFLDDIELAEEAGSWQNLINCVVHHASIFAIITARQHSPEIIKAGMRKILLKKLTKEQLEKFKTKFSERRNKLFENETYEEILDEYLDLCRFYPVNNKIIRDEFGPDKSTGELKAATFQHFRKYIYTFVKENYGEDVEVKVGFSDDSISNLNSIINEVLKQHGLFFYHTQEDKKVDFF